MEEINNKDENIKMENKNNFKFELVSKIEIKSGYDIKCIEKIIELPQDKIGIICKIRYEECSFLRYSSKTFKMIKQFDNFYLDAIKMEDNNLVFFNKNNIYIYELIDNEYKLIQTIECYKKKEVDDNYSYYPRYYRNPNTRIYFIYPLKNGNLIACSYSQIKIYKKENGKKGKYSFKTIDFEYRILEILEIKRNIIIIYMMKRLGSPCICEGYNHYIYLYNLQNDNKNIIAEGFSDSGDIYNMYPIKHLLQLE